MKERKMIKLARLGDSCAMTLMWGGAPLVSRRGGVAYRAAGEGKFLPCNKNFSLMNRERETLFQ